MFENRRASPPPAASSTSCGRASCDRARVCMARSTPQKPSRRPASLRGVSGSRRSSREEQAAREEEADPEDGEGRGGVRQDAARHEGGRPDQHVKYGGAGTYQPGHQLWPDRPPGSVHVKGMPPGTRRCASRGAALAEHFAQRLAVRPELRLVARLPGRAQLRVGEYPVGPTALADGAPGPPPLLDAGAAEEPVAVVYFIYFQARLEDHGAREPRVVLRVGVLLDVEVLLHNAAGIGEERPLRSQPVAVLVGGEQVVGRDGDEARVPDLQLGMETDQLHRLAAVFGAVPPGGEEDDHGGPSLPLGNVTESCGL